uniref:Uncharacterized protein n=2 Tax=Oryza TaxID=4527 RepID=A0A0E0PJ70_ORYRU
MANHGAGLSKHIRVESSISTSKARCLSNSCPTRRRYMARRCVETKKKVVISLVEEEYEPIDDIKLEMLCLLIPGYT